MGLRRRCIPIPRRKEEGSRTSSEGQAATIALKTQKPLNASGSRHDRWHSYSQIKALSRPLRFPDSCATAVATGVESSDVDGFPSSSTYKKAQANLVVMTDPR
ncbi:hypothetical protein RF11_04988 [Thelohanellus kitauei]|uniref:Uncharacterized protein n=1 Tax=Thelohanellus kitauei TaxID=669202 RepID=A0A0C2MWE4_THEKT|nr:hypothetical protein RF11_04988 [Thelohanellus kitauei]